MSVTAPPALWTPIPVMTVTLPPAASSLSSMVRWPLKLTGSMLLTVCLLHTRLAGLC